MPKALPKEFREGVIRVFRDSYASAAQVAKDLGILPSCLKRWFTTDDNNSSNPLPAARAANESDALREAQAPRAKKRGPAPGRCLPFTG